MDSNELLIIYFVTAAGFRVRRVKTDLSIGDRLKRARIRRKITVAEIEEATKIRAKFILALEGDSWDQIPSEVYGRGYLDRYATYLGVDTKDIMQQYDRERLLYARNCQDAQIELAPKNRFTLPKFLFTPKMFVYAIVAIGLILGGTQVTRQVYKFTSAPFLKIATPVQAATDASLVVNATSVEVTGQTTIGATVYVNENAVPTNEDGSFNSKVEVQKGYNTIVIKAVSSNGKETSETLSVMVR